MGIRLQVVMPWDQSWGRRSHRERYPIHGRVDKLKPIHEMMQGGKRADVNSPEVFGITPFGFGGLPPVFREGHIKLVGGFWDE
jgi:hypothetical protein